MERKYAGFVPFIDEHHWWANAAALGNRDCSCSRCGCETYEAAMDDVSELCFVCAAAILPDEVVIVESDDCPHYDGPQSDVWHAARARENRFEARLARGER